jgi:hypothetical protein
MLGLKDCRSIYVSYLGSSLSLSLSLFFNYEEEVRLQNLLIERKILMAIEL